MSDIIINLAWVYACVACFTAGVAGIRFTERSDGWESSFDIAIASLICGMFWVATWPLIAYVLIVRTIRDRRNG